MNQADRKMQKITQKKITDFIGRIDWKMWYDDKIIFLKNLLTIV